MSGGVPEAVSRLAAARGEQAPFLLAHHVEAARRLAGLFERARLMQRVTMSYDPTRVGGKGGGGAQADISDTAAEARKRLADLAGTMATDCWSVLFDTCGLDRGLQEIETQRDWPRRGGKLVLRIALAQLATQYGLEPEARGNDAVRQRHWLPERLAMFGEDAKP